MTYQSRIIAAPWTSCPPSTTSPAPRPPTLFERARLARAHRAGRWAFRVRRYGMPLAARWAVASRLPVTNPWRARVKARVNEIDTRHLR